MYADVVSVARPGSSDGGSAPQLIVIDLIGGESPTLRRSRLAPAASSSSPPHPRRPGRRKPTAAAAKGARMVMLIGAPFIEPSWFGRTGVPCCSSRNGGVENESPHGLTERSCSPTRALERRRSALRGVRAGSARRRRTSPWSLPSSRPTRRRPSLSRRRTSGPRTSTTSLVIEAPNGVELSAGDAPRGLAARPRRRDARAGSGGRIEGTRVVAFPSP